MSPFVGVSFFDSGGQAFDEVEVYSESLSWESEDLIIEGRAILDTWRGRSEFASARFTLHDLQGLRSEPVETVLRASERVEADAPCDSTGARSVCDETRICTGEGTPTCQVPVSECAGFDAQPLSEGADGRFGSVDHAAGSCGGMASADQVYVADFEAGRWAATLQLEAPNLPVIYARRYCSQGGRWSEIACNTEVDFEAGQASIEFELDAPETIYLFADWLPGAEPPETYRIELQRLD